MKCVTCHYNKNIIITLLQILEMSSGLSYKYRLLRIETYIYIYVTYLIVNIQQL